MAVVGDVIFVIGHFPILPTSVWSRCDHTKNGACISSARTSPVAHRRHASIISILLPFISTRRTRMLTSRGRIIGLIITSALPTMIGCSSGILLSRTTSVSNSDYPDDLKKRIVALRATLSEQDARRILRDSLGEYVVENSEPRLDAVADDSLIFTATLEFNNPTAVRTTQSAQITTYHHYSEQRQVQVPFADVRHIRIKTDGSRRHVDFVTPLRIVKSPYYGVSLFRAGVKPNTDEPALIASLLLLFTNLEESSWANF